LAWLSYLQKRRLEMAHFSQTTAWINYAKSVRKHHEDARNAYYMKFIRGNAVPTQNDVDEYAKVLAAMKAAAKQMKEDLMEIESVGEPFGGSSDMVIGPAGILLDTLNKEGA
jgi:hypothetical protein